MDLFTKACEKGNCEIAIKTHRHKSQEELEEGLLLACGADSVSLVQFLYSKTFEKALTGRHMAAACGGGCIDIVRFIIEKSPALGHSQKGFDIACAEGHMDVARILWHESLTKDKAILWAAHNDYVRIVRWLETEVDQSVMDDVFMEAGPCCSRWLAFMHGKEYKLEKREIFHAAGGAITYNAKFIETDRIIEGWPYSEKNGSRIYYSDY
jgi:hypothetical protein